MSKSLLHLLSYLKKYPKETVLNIVCNLVYIVFSLVSLAMIGPFLSILFDKIQPMAQVPELTFDVESIINYFNYYLGQTIDQSGKSRGLALICGFVAIVFLINNLARYGAAYFLAPIRNGIIRDLRNAIYQKSLQLPVAYFSDKRKGDILARTSVDVQEVEHGILSVVQAFVKSPLTIIGYLFALIYINPQLTLMAMVILPLGGFVIARVAGSLKRSSTKAQNQQGGLLSMMEETLSGLRIIKAFNAEEQREGQFAYHNDKQAATMNKVLRRKDLASPMTEVLGIGVVVLILYLGGRIVLNQQGAGMSAEAFITFVLIFSQLLNPAKAFTSAWYNMVKGVASMERIEELLLFESPVKEGDNTRKIENFEQDIVFENVGFSYEKTQTVLKGINGSIQKGKTVALVGPSGVGKSTLVDLVLKFYEASSGEIRIDGIPINEIKTDSLRSMMGLVTQEAILFNDTVLNNLKLGNEQATEAEVIEAAKVANAHDFISQLENGYHTIIGDRGGKLSGGEKQRLTIARALLKNPPILILDEATSSLDAQSEKLVQEALEKVMQNRTSLIIAHRFSTIQHADEIWVMDNGKIVEMGSPQELQSQDSAYRRLADLQKF